MSAARGGDTVEHHTLRITGGFLPEVFGFVLWQVLGNSKITVNCPHELFIVVYLQVKRVMNGVFHSLRGEFDLGESYSGQAVLGVIVSTIKVSAFA